MPKTRISEIRIKNISTAKKYTDYLNTIKETIKEKDAAKGFISPLNFKV